jgi:hypothetical protein
LGGGDVPGVDAGGMDASGRDLGGGSDGGTGVDVPIAPVDLGSDFGLTDAGCFASTCAPGTMCNPTTGTCDPMPDAGCMAIGCSGGLICHPDGTCGACDTAIDGCCPQCDATRTCDVGTHTCVSSSGCGGDGQDCCFSLSPCDSHFTCTGWGGTCTHCGRTGEPCCGGGCDGGGTCGWDGLCS